MNKEIREDADLRNLDAADFYDFIAKISHDRSPATVAGKDNLRERGGERVSWRLPVDLGIARGVTRDIGVSGVYFETDATYPLLSSSIHFEMELDTPNGKILLKCLGEIVRVEPRDKKVGVAVKIIESSMEPVWLT